MISLTIDGRTVEVPPGTTVLQAARQIGIEIPTLCDHPALEPYGGCRLCLVEVEGFRTLTTSCTLPVNNGMVVHTDTPAVHSSRKFVLDMIFSERNHFCMFCQKTDGDCELQNAAYSEDMDHWPIQPSWKNFAVDSSHPYFVIDHNRCILCRRCVRACSELVGNSTLSLENRGAHTMLVAGIADPIGESNCIRCGTCYQVCPTGAIIDRNSAYLAKDAETERVSSICVGCSVGCGIEMVIHEGSLIRIEGDWNSPINGGLLCEQGRYLSLPNGRQRLTTPLLRQEGELRPVSWEQALETVANRLSRGKVSGIVSTRLSAEALFAFKNIFIDQLHSQAVACTDEDQITADETIQPLNNAFSALKSADCYIVIGADLKESHPVAGFFIRRNLLNGAELILIDPHENGFSPLTWHNLRLSSGTDAQLLEGLLVSLIQMGAAQSDTANPGAANPGAAYHGAASVDLSIIADATELSLESIQNAASAIAAAKNPVFVIGKGLTRPDNAQALQALLRLAAIIKAEIVHMNGKANSLIAHRYGLDRSFVPAAGAPLYIALGDDHPTPRLLEKLQDVSFLAVQASYVSDLTERADVVLPVEIWAEQEGYYLNLEGRLQKANRGLAAPVGVHSNLEVLQRLAACMNLETTPVDQDPLVVERNAVNG